MTFARLGSDVAALRAAGDPRGAEALAASHRDRYPGEWHAIDWWRISAANAAGDVDHAIGVLQTAVDRGDWYPSDHLRDERDAGMLQGDPRFEALAAECLVRHQAALQRARPALTIAGAVGLPPWPALMVLHGNGEPVTSVVEHWATSGRALLAPQSGSPSGPGRHVWAAATTGEIVGHLASLDALGAIAGGDLVAGGFARGGYHALRMALTGHIPARGVIAVAPAMNDISEIEDAIPAAAARGLRVAFLAGSDDPKPAAAVERVGAELRDGGLAVTVEIVDGVSREYPPDFAARLAAMLAFVAP